MIQPFNPQTYQYKAPDGKTIPVTEELWKWQAEYKDFTCLRQFDLKTGLFHSMREIDTSRLKSLFIQSSSYRETFVVAFPTSDPFELTIKHYRRREDGIWSTFFVFGYRNQRTGQGEYLVIHHDEATWTDDYQKVISV